MVRWAIFKRSVIGRPLASDELHEQLLPKTLALPVFASDPLSSVAYATEESMLVLALAGAAAFAYITPVSVAIALLLLIVIISYRQTIRAYPDGGGAFIVAHENLGLQPAMVAAAALLTDYTLTVSVSVAAGVAAITSAFPVISDWRVEISVGLVILLTLANLRGVKESSTVFAIPTYAFVVTVFVMLVTGFVECIDGECPQAISAGTEVVPEVAAVSLFLILRGSPRVRPRSPGWRRSPTGCRRSASRERTTRQPLWRSWVPSRSRCSSGSAPWRGSSMYA